MKRHQEPVTIQIEDQKFQFSGDKDFIFSIEEIRTVWDILLGRKKPIRVLLPPHIVIIVGQELKKLNDKSLELKERIEVMRG